MRIFQGVLIGGVAALLVYWVWPATDGQANSEPATQTMLPNARTALTGNYADGSYANAADLVPTPGADLPNTSQLAAQPYDSKAGESRQARSDDLLKQKPWHTWANWDATISRGDPHEVGMLIPAMGYALRKEGTQAAYNEMAMRLAQSGGTVQSRLDILGALSYAATPEAVRVMLDYGQSLEHGRISAGGSVDDQQAILRATQQGIQRASREFIDGGRNWGISPALESAWANMGGNASLGTRSVIAQAIVYLGKPDGLKVLIDSVEQGILSAEASKVALSAIAQLGSNDAVPFIGKKLNQPTPSSIPNNTDLTEALVRGLVSVGSAEAMNQIVNYLNQPSTNQQFRASILAKLQDKNVSSDVMKAINANK